MTWSYSFLSGIARHSETGKEFRVERSMPEDHVSISTADGEPHGLEPSDLEALANLCISEKNRYELLGLIHTLFQNDFSKAVVTLNKADGRKASVRTLQAWLDASRQTEQQALSNLGSHLPEKLP